MSVDWPVLVINPSRDAADFVRFALVDAGWDTRRVQWAPDLTEALAHLRRGTPRVIISSIHIRDARGTNILDLLRAEAPDVPIVGIADVDVPVDTGARRGGAHAYILKKYLEIHLVDTIRAAIERVRFERQLRADHAADLDRRQADVIGRLADSTTFEVNNALAIVSTAINRLESLVGAQPAHQDALNAAREGIARAARAVDGLLAAGGRRPMTPRATDFRQLVDVELPRIQRAVGPDAIVETWYMPGLPPIHADAGALGQVLSMLAGRARGTMEDGGELLIRAQVAADSRSVEILVLDDGAPTVAAAVAVDAELIRARSIIEESGGTFDVSNRWPTGTQVRIRLPIADTPPTVSAPETRPTASTEQSRPVVLVVEDEVLLQGLLVRALADHGYRTCAASDEEEAIREAERMGHIDAVITDVVLPKGRLGVMLQTLIKRWPHVALVLMTGAPQHAHAVLRDLSLDAPVLGKPFRLPELFSAIQIALEEAQENAENPTLGSRPRQ